MTLSQRFLPTLATFICAAHFGLFLAWVCTTMWGLDNADPRVAIAAMQAMNAAVRNAVFLPIFVGPPVLLLLAGMLLLRPQARPTAFFFLSAGALVLGGSVILTMTANVPMNEELGALSVPQDAETAHAIWQAYSPDWQFWNVMRTLASGAATLLALIGLQMLPRNV